MNIGYWGIPGTDRTTMVHVQEHGQRTLCGHTMSKKYEFQWCARMTERMFIHRYIECGECKKRIIRMMDKEAEEAEKKLAARASKKAKRRRSTATAARDTREAAVCADTYMNLARCVGGHVLVSGLKCPHCDSYNPEEECHKEKIDLTKEK